MALQSIDVPTPAALPRSGPAPAARLPSWPVTMLFALYPLWWLLGVADVIWVVAAVAMALYLRRARAVRAPRGFGLWLLFLAWAAASMVMTRSVGDLLGFGYRYAIYLSATALFVYVYNARRALGPRFVAGILTCWWLITVAGGFLGLLLPTVVVRTPMSHLLSASLQANELVSAMVVRRFAQFNPDSYFAVGPRPSAPFLYTNNWGNVYSLLLPFVVLYLLQVRRERRRFTALLVMLPVSAVPAVLTLNRGMFLGVAIALVYVGLRLALRRNLKAILTLALVAVVGIGAYSVLPAQEGLQSRLGGETNSNTDRSSLYIQALGLVPHSPVLGYGGPQPADPPGSAPVGTQGQVWLLLVSHGPIAALCFVGFFALAFWRIRRRADPLGIACATTLLVGTVELGYYGVVPNGLPLMMIAAAVGLRGERAVRR
ncbi:MAG: O-antigen ligase family protein [Nocardioidaceae bacterium]